MTQQRVTHTAALGGAGKNIVVAYLLWWFLGGLGIHRFYLERPKTGVAQLLLFIFGWIPLFLGWIALGIWWLLDAYFVQEYVRQYNEAHDGSPLAVSLTTTTDRSGAASNNQFLLSGFSASGHVVRLLLDPAHGRSAHPGFTIGRAEYCDMMLDDPTVSREHARIVLENGVFILRDLGSSNGTFRNEQRLAIGVATYFSTGDILRIGKVTLSVSPA